MKLAISDRGKINLTRVPPNFSPIFKVPKNIFLPANPSEMIFSPISSPVKLFCWISWRVKIDRNELDPSGISTQHHSNLVSMSMDTWFSLPDRQYIVFLKLRCVQWRGAWGLNKLNKRLWEIEDADWLDVGGENRNLTKGKIEIN